MRVVYKNDAQQAKSEFYKNNMLEDKWYKVMIQQRKYNENLAIFYIEVDGKAITDPVLQARPVSWPNTALWQSDQLHTSATSGNGFVFKDFDIKNSTTICY